VVADADADIRDMLLAMLQLDGYEVVGNADDGDVAIEVVGAVQPDLVILDLHMPRLSGLDALPRITEVAPSTTVVVLSAFVADSVAEEVLRRGAVTYVEKGGIRALRQALADLEAEAVSETET
jgi:DNA-binding NarL/FixJ family response regulator